jgi:hypothetical protein
MLPSARTLAVATLLAAPFAGAAQSPTLQATGEVYFLAWGEVGVGISYGDDRIVGPNVNLTRRDDGGWAGDLLGQNVDLMVTPTRLSAPNFDVHVERKADLLVVRGNVFGRRFSIEMTPKELSGRSGNCSFDLSRRGPGLLRGSVGCADPRSTFPSTGTSTLKLAGDAAQREPSLPQLALALIAALSA